MPEDLNEGEEVSEEENRVNKGNQSAPTCFFFVLEAEIGVEDRGEVLVKIELNGEALRGS